MTDVRRVELPLGLGSVTPMTAPEVCRWILQPPASPRTRILANLNLHGTYLAYRDEPFRRFTRLADAVLIDGWPILQLARAGAARGQYIENEARLGSTDWLEHLIRMDPDITIVAVGGSPDSSRGMSEYVARRSTQVRWVAFDGYSLEAQGSVGVEAGGRVDEWLPRADLVLVGMGMPVQEKWVLDRLVRCSVTAVVANVGGCFDYFSGHQSLAPRWMGRFGLEWLYRLVHSPRRLVGRYLWEPIKLGREIVLHRGRPVL
ncbi:WecB/TagA/CpsF family glycosyltransferase [Microbacterium sp. NPDC076911]|uniref:WecB/TagA/CpsF family glycosyltransferase n=1 Tax=Microbacterium sp. NPDC076911 TaxID=3154958 RepID=UPI0034332C7E